MAWFLRRYLASCVQHRELAIDMSIGRKDSKFCGLEDGKGLRSRRAGSMQPSIEGGLDKTSPDRAFRCPAEPSEGGCAWPHLSVA